MKKLFLAFSIVLLTPVISLAAKVEELTDLSSSHWAYKAIMYCVDKYQILDGYPDKTFKGDRNITRYEAAASFYKILLRAEQLVRQNMISQEDLKLIKDLKEEFKKEIDILKKQSNKDQEEKIANLEKKLEEIKKDIGVIRFGGGFGASMNDNLQDNFRPSYSADFGLDMKVNIDEKTNMYSSWGGSFSSRMQEKKEEGQPTSSEVVQESNLGFGNAWLEYNHGGFLSPSVKVGYMSMWNIIQPSTSLPFGGLVGLNNPGRKRGIRTDDSVILGINLGEGPFSMGILANPDLFAAQLGLNFGLVRFKVVADADQSIWIGEIVQDPIHNELVILDIGNRNFGISLQGAFRGVGNKYDFRAASGLITTSFWGFSLGLGARYENESSQQVVVGGSISTPSRWGEIAIPQLTITAQEPLTIQNGLIYEGSLIKDKASFSVKLYYDNPFIPNLTISWTQRSDILFPPQNPTGPKEFIQDTISVSTGFGF